MLNIRVILETKKLQIHEVFIHLLYAIMYCTLTVSSF